MSEVNSLNNMIIFTLALLVLQNTNYTGFITETESAWQLNNSNMIITISKMDGNIHAIFIKNKNLISNSCWLDISENLVHENSIVVQKQVNDYSPLYCQVCIQKDYPDKIVKHNYTIDTLSLYWEIVVTSKLSIDKELSVNFHIPLIKSMDSVFYAGKDMPTTLQNRGTKKITYRKNIFLPVMTFYNSEEVYGLSVITPLEIAKPGLSFSTDQDKLTVSYHHLRLTSNRKVKAAIYIVPHEDDWRAGLKFLLYKYPEYFYPKVEHTRIGEGWYTQGRPSDDELKIKKVTEKGVKWIEFLYYFPFLGLYNPDVQNWGLISNSDDVTLSDWEKGAGVRRNSYINIKNLISLWHKYGIQVYLYFQSFEAWHQYAKKYFLNDIAMDESGSPHAAWKFTNLMNPDPSTKWGQYTISQARGLIKKYPELDGIFYDRLDYWNYDFAHDDGITTVGGKTAYMLGFAQEKINEKIFDIFHRHGKGIWGNGPTSIEVCRNLDGIMAETHPLTLYKIQYLGVVRPIIFLPYDHRPQETEEKLKTSLVCGAFPSITYGDTTCQRLDGKYRPLFEHMKNREWVLSKNPLQIPVRFTGNIFKTPEGDYVVTVISSEKSQLIPDPFEYNIPITITLHDAYQINSAYLLSGDWQGINSIDFNKDNNTITINLPYHLSTSMIYLTKKREFELIRLSSPILIQGTEKSLIFRLDKISSENPTTVGVETPWFKKQLIVTGNLVNIQTTVPKDIIGEVDITVYHNGKNHHFTGWIVEPISIAPLEKIFIQNTAGERVPFYFVNNSERTIAFITQGRFVRGSGSVVLPNRIDIQPFETKVVDVLVTSDSDGVIEISANLDKEKVKKLMPVKTSLSFSKDDLFHDDFSHGIKNWTINKGNWVILNGIAQGSGPSHFAFIRNDNWHDYVYEVKTRCKGSDNPTVDWLKSYIFFRLQNERNFYRFGIHGGSEVIDIYKCVNGNWIKLASTPFTAQEDKWYALKIEVRGNKFIGYVNGEIIIETNDDTFPAGGIGIGVLEDALKCHYKDVIVKRL